MTRSLSRATDPQMPYPDGPRCLWCDRHIDERGLCHALNPYRRDQQGLPPFAARATATRVVLALLLLLLATPAWAANRCTQTATGTCASRHDTIQVATDAANPSDTVVIGPGTYTEAVVVAGKKVIYQGQDGMDWRAEPDATLLTSIDAPYVELRDVVMHPSGPFAIGFRVVGVDGYMNKVTRGLIDCEGTGGRGISFEGGQRHTGYYARVDNCAVGLQAVNVVWAKIQNSRSNGNAIGVRLVGGPGQHFYAIVHVPEGGTGLQAEGTMQYDINSNDVYADGCLACVGVIQALGLSGEVNRIQEYGLNEFWGFAGREFQVQRLDGSWSFDPHDDPGCSVQYGSNQADGVPLPSFTTPVC